MAEMIRLSEFIFNYGPGAILESEQGPTLIKGFKEGLFYEGHTPDKYEIRNGRVSRFLCKPGCEVKIFELPSNDDRDKQSGEYIYKTMAFPTWKLCAERHSTNDGILYDAAGCPSCGNDKNEQTKAVQFVTACQRGHLGDVPWEKLIHDKVNNGCKNKEFVWKRSGAALKDVDIKCRECEASKPLSSLFYKLVRCGGQILEKNSKEQCGEKAQIIRRHASNIRIPEIKTFLSIRSTYTNLHEFAEDEKIKTTINNAISIAKDDPDQQVKFLRQMMENIENIPTNAKRVFKEANIDELRDVLEYMKEKPPDTYYGMLVDEFHSLQKASKEGSPLICGNSNPSFEVIKQDVRNFDVRGMRFTVAPVRTLKTVSVQTGYRRAISSQNDVDDSGIKGEMVPIHYNNRKDNVFWYPGAVFMGEGVFISVDDPNHIHGLHGGSKEAWDVNHGNRDLYGGEFIFKDLESKHELHPGFIWWHTLSHILIRMIGEDAGYSPASIRERIYLDSEGDRPMGGILLYSTQPGADGTLGGLTGLVPHFGDILDRALEMAHACSADPICGDQETGHRMINGSCCYGCLMNSETSCDHRNMWLDRKIVMENTDY